MITPLLKFESLQLLDAIARRGSFGAAAKELGRVPSAVTYAVRKLEGDLDVLLFDRRGYRAQLTAAGEELLREGRQLLSAAEDLTRRVQRLANGWERELRIALDTVIPFDRLLPFLKRFCQHAPTQLRINTEVLGGTWDALLDGRADLALGAVLDGPQIDRLGTGYRVLELGQVPMVFALAPNHPLAAVAEPLSLAQLRQHRQIVVSDSSRRLAPRASHLFGANDLLLVPTMEAKLAAQCSGLGVGFLPRALAQPLIKQGRLVVRQTVGLGAGDQGASTAYVAWRTDGQGKALQWWLAEFKKAEQRAVMLS